MFLLHSGQSPVRTFHHVSEMCAVILGIFFNVALMFVVRRHRRGPLKSYGRVVMMNCIMDFVLTLTTMISEVQTDAQDGAMFMVSNGYLGSILPPKFHHVLNWIWTVGLGFSILYQPVPFYHRYFTICSNQEPSRRRMAAIFAMPICMCIWNTTWMLAATYLIPNPQNYSNLIDYPTWTLPDGKVPIYVMLHITQISTWIFAVSCAISFPLATGLAVWFYWRIYETLRVNKKFMSSRTMKMQAQLNRALLSQIIFPCIFGIAPVTGFMFMLLFYTKIHGLPIIMSSMLSWIPVFNPILTFGLVNAYRHDLMRPFGCYGSKGKNLTTEVSSITRPFRTNVRRIDVSKGDSSEEVVKKIPK